LWLVLMYYRRTYPLKSRKIGPFLLIFIQMSNMNGYFLMSYWNFEQRNYYLCYVEAYLVYPFTEISFIIPSILLLRFLAVIRVKRMKILQYQNEKEGAEKTLKLPLKFWILKKLGMDLVLIVLSIAIIVIAWICFTIVLAISNFQCSKLQDNLFVVVHAIISSTLTLIYYIAVFYDIIYNFIIYIVIGKCQIWNFIKSDYFYFRFENFYSFGLYTMFIIFFFTDHSDIFHFTLSGIMRWYILGGLCLNPLVISIIRNCIRRKKKITGNKKKIMDELFQDPEMLKHFEKLCELEFSIENFLFRVDATEFKKLNQTQMLKRAQEIFDTYYGSTSSYELNLTGKTVKGVKDALLAGIVNSETFDGTMKEVDMNLSGNSFKGLI
jgi:hypothetical protein